jgi:hypothetical protein
MQIFGLCKASQFTINAFLRDFGISLCSALLQPLSMRGVAIPWVAHFRRQKLQVKSKQVHFGRDLNPRPAGCSQ